MLRGTRSIPACSAVFSEVNDISRALDDSLRERIEKRLRPIRDPLAEQSPSEWSFNNLYLFRRARDWRYAESPIPHLRGRGYDGSVQLIVLHELERIELATLGELQGETGWFCPVPESWLQRLDPDAFVWRAERDDADYLYAAAAFHDYAGVGLGSKRAAVDRLHARHQLQVRHLDASSWSAAMEILEGWCRDKNITTAGADVLECREALSLLKTGVASATLFGYLHLADDLPAGFVLCEELNPGVIVVRFAKGLQRFDGIFPNMYQHLARRTERLVKWLNFEQDLGRPNFRRSKLSFQPVRLLPKYRVRVRV